MTDKSIRRFGWMAVLFAVSIAVAVPVAPSAATVNMETSTIDWDWAQGGGGVVTEFRVKVGPASGNYTRTTVVQNPAARSLDALTAIGVSGTWWAIVTAANADGESSPSNEISFDAFYIRTPADALTPGETIGTRAGQTVRERLQIRRRLTP